MQTWLDATQDVLADPASATWDNFCAVEEAQAVHLDHAFSPVSHLHSVADSPEWREVYAQAIEKLTIFHTELDQSKPRFEAMQTIANSADFKSLSAAQQRIVENSLRDFRLAGIDLDDEKRAQYRELVRELSQLSTQFQQNLQDATDAWSLHFDDADGLSGLPDSALEQARQRAADMDLQGFVVNLEMPSYQAILTYADDRGLRETLYRAYTTRASDQGPNAGQWDNSDLVLKILKVRESLASLLGFASYADYSLETKMAQSPQQVLDFLNDLAGRAHPRALEEVAELTEFARRNGGPEQLAPWDIAYYAEKLRQEQFDISDEEVRPYFEAGRSLAGMMDVVTELFGIRFQEDTSVETWHPSVRYFAVSNDQDEVIASFYVDLFARKGKRGGAWMADCRSRYVSQKPVAFLNCNFAAPSEQSPSLLNHNELTTLFHEFGHSLHHMLTEVTHPAVGGISGVEWDAVELPSQFLENWCWENDALSRFARHHQTNAVIPDDLVDRLRAARHFHSGLFLVRQLEFALTDMALHTDTPDDYVGVLAMQETVKDRVAAIKTPAENRFINGFGHLFAGGYAAGYYSYLWAEQLSADAYARFLEDGIFNRQTGEAFRAEVLAVGGSRDAMESFQAFRGRAPSVTPLLESYGIQ